MKRWEWLQIATEKIAFPPDALAVRRELEQHIDDRRDNGLRRGLTEQEAERQALLDMGDAADIAEELGRLHRPWWGRLWQLSRWVAAAAALALAVTLLRTDFLWREGWHTPELRQAGYHQSSTEGMARTVDVLADWEPTGSAAIGAYRLTVPRAWVEYNTGVLTDTGHTWAEYTLVVPIRVTTWRFWERSDSGQSMLLDRQATDSDGAAYIWGSDLPGRRGYFCKTYVAGPCTVWYVAELTLPDAQIPDWMDIGIGCGTAGIRVDLQGGEVRSWDESTNGGPSAT